jgi:acyl-coenzyme A thioesterase 13
MTAVDVSNFPQFAVRKFLGGTVLDVDGASGQGTIRYVVSDQHINPVGTVFGGFLASMIDDAASLGAWFSGRQRPFATASMTVNYFNPAKPGDVLLAKINVPQSGARQAFVEVRLLREADCTAIATGMVVQSFLRATDANNAKF